MLRTPARFAILLAAVTATASLALVQREHWPARVLPDHVIRRATAATGDSGIFGSPVLPRGVRPVIPHADAESIAVAMGYRHAPSVQDLTVPYYREIPTERRRYCGRTYFVRPVVAMPDTTVVRTNMHNDWMLWAPTWVIPICDDAGRTSGSVMFSDVPLDVRVALRAEPDAVPELVPGAGTFPHIGYFPARYFRDWERGIGTTPETAVTVAAASLAPTGARVIDVPEAFTIAELLDPSTPLEHSSRIVAHFAACPRWRLTLDRPVTLRGAESAQVVRTPVVYVARGSGGCIGKPVLQIPKPSQPATVPFMYFVRFELPEGAVAPRVDGRPTRLPYPQPRWTTLEVREPVWFEQAVLAR